MRLSHRTGASKYLRCEIPEETNPLLVLYGRNLNYTGCPTKNYTLFWRAVAPLNFELGIKVGGVLESSGSQLFKTVPTFDF